MRIALSISKVLLERNEKQKRKDMLSALYSYVSRLTKHHEVWITCDSSYPEAIIAIRQRLKNILPQYHIQTYYLPFKTNTYQHTEAHHLQVNQLIYDYFLAQFYPDICLSINCKSTVEEDTYQIVMRKRKGKQKHLAKNIAQKPSLAYFSPMPPVKSGIAHYSSQLLPYLALHYDITLVLEQKEAENFHGDTQFKTLFVNDFLKNPKQFDRILYHFGNSFYHTYMWEILIQYPGVVVLHDFYLSGLLSYEELVNDKTYFWTEQLFKSHGYHALQERFDKSKTEDIKYKYPANYEVIQHALGIIVHSSYSKDLAEQWYTLNPLEKWKTLPLLRKPAGTIHKKEARISLGIPQNALLICSFGLLNSTKLNHRLLQTFLDSKLHEDQNCFLVFVGENNSGEYALELDLIIKNTRTKNRIKITGWVDDDTYRQYLKAADISVQLRTASRGESSAAVLDCMNYGIATIVNANGSMADLPKDVLYMLDDDFNDEALLAALEHLAKNPTFRESLGKKSQYFIQTYHSPQYCAFAYKESIEAMYINHSRYTDLISKIASLKTPHQLPYDFTAVSKSISQSTLPKIKQKQLLVDVSAIVRTDLRTGIERVVRAQLLELINIAPNNLRVEPVYLSDEGSLHYRYATKLTCEILGISANIEEKPVEVLNGDLFYGLDFFPDGGIQAARANIYTQWYAAGVSINFAVYDLLPLQYPNFFPEGAKDIHSKWLESIIPISNSVICISQAVAGELKKWISAHLPSETAKNVEVTAVHLGYDIAASLPSIGLPDDAEQILNKIKNNPSFLMVGTIEPRKGHLQILSDFEILWDKGMEINLVIVGKEGWKGLPDSQRRTIPEIIQKLRNHPQLDNRLFWLEGISDVFLEKLYQTSSSLIAASEDEGFGLPLIEASHYNLPIIARDIPVFREVAGDCAFYFPNSKEQSIIADAIMHWIDSYDNKSHILSNAIPCITWKESAQRVLDTLLKTVYDNPTPQYKTKKISHDKHEQNHDLMDQAEEMNKWAYTNPMSPRTEEIYHDLLKKDEIREQK